MGQLQQLAVEADAPPFDFAADYLYQVSATAHRLYMRQAVRSESTESTHQSTSHKCGTSQHASQQLSAAVGGSLPHADTQRALGS
jgi:hypothetical protein